MDGFFIDSELEFLPEKLCYIWTATRDVKQRKLNYPAKHRYGLNFKANRDLFHVFLLILLAGDVTTNPGPCSSFTQSGLKIIYLNARSLKTFVSVDEVSSMQDNAPTTTGLRQFLRRSLYLRDLVEQYHSKR